MSYSTALSALDKALSLSRQTAGQALSGAGSGTLRTPSRPVVPAGTETRAHAIRDRLQLSEQARNLQESREAGAAGPLALSDGEKAQVRQLQARDAEVRSHENAHASAGGGLAGAPSYDYQQGPDGRLYAIGGEVSIQVQEGATPEETLRIAKQVRAAATAPANPSSADMAVAATASSLEMKARAELSAGSREADVTVSAIGDGGSFDSWTRGYQRSPAPAIEAPRHVDVFG